MSRFKPQKGKKSTTEKSFIVDEKQRVHPKSDLDDNQPMRLNDVFIQYDTEGFEKLDSHQIRNYLQQEKGLYLTDQQIKELMFEVVLHSDKVPLNEFGTLDHNINEKKDELTRRSNEINNPSQQHELWLMSEKEIIPSNAIVFDSDDITITQSEKPRRIKTTLTNAVVEYDQMKPEDRTAIETIFSPTIIVKQKQVSFKKAELNIQPFTKIEEKKVDEPNVKYLRESDSGKDPRNIYSNLLGSLDESFQPTKSDVVELCGRVPVTLKNEYQELIDMFIVEIPKIGLVMKNETINEPLFGVFSIYDASEHDLAKAKLTEDFHVDVNSSDQRKPILELSGDDALNNDLNTFCVCLRKSVVEKPNLKCVLMIYKIAESDQNAARDMYVIGLKDSKVKTKTQSRTFTQLNKQYLGTGFIDLKEALTLKNKCENIPIYRDEVENIKDLIQLFEAEKTGKVKKMTLGWNLNINRFDPKNADRKYRLLDPSGFDLKSGFSKQTILRQIEDFTSLNDVCFFMDYVNNVYIYPFELILPAKERKRCNFVITVYIREDDDQFHRDNHLGVFYSTTSMENSFKKLQKTSVGSGGKTDTFMDEIKAKLPAKLMSQHHILFVIQDVSLDGSTTMNDDKAEKKTFFASLPFLEKGKLINDNEYTLPIYSGLPFEGYLTSTYKPLVESTDKVKPGLKIRLKFMTSVNVQDDSLHGFLGSISEANYKERDSNIQSTTEMEKTLDRSVEDLKKADKKADKKSDKEAVENTLIHHFPFIMRSLLDLYHNDFDALNVLKYILKVIKLVMKDDHPLSRPQLLSKYIEFYFGPNRKSSKAIFPSMLQSMTKMFSELASYNFQKETDEQFEMVISILRYSWFFYEMIVKSLTLEMNSSNLLNNSESLKFFRSHVSDSDEYALFSSNLVKYVDVHARAIRRILAISIMHGHSNLLHSVIAANSHFALFLSDLLRVFRRSTVLECIDKYLSNVASVYDRVSMTYFTPKDPNFKYAPPSSNLFFPTSSMGREDAETRSSKAREIGELLRIDFMSILMSSPYFVELSVPVVTPTKIDQTYMNLNQYTSLISQKHLFSTIITRNMLLLISRATNTSKYALSVMVRKIMMLDTDVRYQEPKIKASIAEMFFGIILYIVEQNKLPNVIWHPSQTLYSSGEVENFFILFIWILKNINHSTLEYYLTIETSSHIASFLGLIKRAFDVLTKGTVESRDIQDDVISKRKNIIDSHQQRWSQSKGVLQHSMNDSHNDSSSSTSMKTTSSSFDKFAKQHEQKEAVKTHWENIKDDVLLVILDVITTSFSLLNTREQSLTKTLTTFLSSTLFSVKFPPHYSQVFLKSIRKLITTHANYILTEQPSFGFNLLRAVLALCNNSDYQLRQAATSVLYLFIKANYQISNNTLASRVSAISAIAEIAEKDDGSAIRSAILALPLWAELDSTALQNEKKNEKKNEEKVTTVKSRERAVKRRKELIEIIENERGGDGRSWAKQRMVRYLARRWNDKDILEGITQIEDKIEETVKKEGKVSNLRKIASEKAEFILEKFRDLIGGIGNENDSVGFEQWKTSKLQEINDLLKEFEEIYNALMSVGGALGGSVTDYRVIEGKLADLCGDREKVLKSKEKAKEVGGIRKIEFMKQHQEKQKEIAIEFDNVCNKLAQGNDLQQSAIAAMEEFLQLKNSAGKAHDYMKELDGANGGANVWEVLFGQWKSVLPKTSEILQRIIDMQKKLKDSEREYLDTMDKILEELAIAEELVKVAAFEVDVAEVFSFDGSNVSDVKNMCSELLREYSTIEKSNDAVNKWYMKDEKQHHLKHGEKPMLFVLFEKIQLTPKSKLSDAAKKFKALYREERQNEARRNEYVQLLDILVDLVESGGNEPSSQVLEIGNKLRNLENTRTPLLQKSGEKQLKKITELASKKVQYKILLPGQEVNDHPKENSIKELFSTEFLNEIKLLQDEIHKMFDFMNHHQSLEKQMVGKDVFIDDIFKFAQEYASVPTVHFKWYNLLEEEQKKRGNHVEAGVCCVHFVAYIYKFLQNKIPLLDEHHLMEITTDFLDYQPPLLRTENEQLTEKSLVDWVFKGIHSFSSANLHSFAIALCYFILPYFSANHDFRKLQETHQQIMELYTNMVDTNNRYIGYFYLVTFHGNFPNTGKEYVYRSCLRIKEFQTYLIQMHSSNSKLPPATILEAKKQADANARQISVINVSPFNEDGSAQVTGDFPHTSIFCSEVRVTLDGAKPDVLEKACKRRTVLEVKHSFPSVLEREEVIKKTENQLSPIQSSTDDINAKVIQLATLLEKKDELRLSSLQIVLKGILSAEVNGGPGAICKTFLNKDALERNKYPKADVQKLFNVMQYLLDKCKEGLAIHKGQMKAEAAGLQNIFELGFLQLERTIKEAKVLVDGYALSN
ncbi:Dedicator of cytokinesis protein [Entamoeba marina]